MNNGADIMAQIASGQIDAGRIIAAADSLMRQGGEGEAVNLYRLWLQYNGGNPLVYAVQYNLGVLLSRTDPAAAVEAFKAAVAANPDFYPAYINLGTAYERMGGTSEAVTQWLTLVNRLGAVNAEAVTYKSTALKQIGRVLEHTSLEESAEDALKQCIEMVQAPDAMQHWIAIRQKLCKWPVLSGLAGVDRRKLFDAMSPHCVVFHTDDPLLHLARGHRYYRSKVGRPALFFDRDSHRAALAARPKDRRIRIAYLSSYFREHAHGFLTAEMYKMHDRSRFEVFAYSCSRPSTDRIQTQLRKDVDHFIDIAGLPDEEVARRIHADGIDILIDFNGYTGEARPVIPAMRPAPINVNWLGYPGTMGSPYHDYKIADAFTIPEGSEIFYSEKIVRLPCYQPNDRNRLVANIPWNRPAAGLPEGAVVFCAFNSVQKITSAMWARFMDILCRVPNGVLWLLDGGERINERLCQEAIRHGVTPDRIIFAPKIINPEHLSRYPLADLFLDTSPCGAHTTASDALWMGVPVLTVAGRGFASRVCGSLATAAGLGDMVCASFDEYVEKAVELGNDKRALGAVRERLALNRPTCDLFNTDKLVAHLDNLYQSMWEDFVADRVPVPDLTNLEVYDEIGTGLDAEGQELISRPDYLDLYRAELARIDRHYPLPADSRLWPGHAGPTGIAAPSPAKAKPAKGRKGK